MSALFIDPRLTVLMKAKGRLGRSGTSIYNNKGWVLGRCTECGQHNYVEPHGTTETCTSKTCRGKRTEHENIPYSERDSFDRLKSQRGGDLEKAEQSLRKAEGEPQARYHVFHRTWYQRGGAPGAGPKTTLARGRMTESQAREMAQSWNRLNPPGPRSRKAEYMKVG